MGDRILTRILILSDTHGERLKKIPKDQVDVAIHCGDITEESKLSEYKAMIEQLSEFNAPLKLVIAGNHDFTLDTPTFQKKLVNVQNEADLIKREYGDFGEAKALFKSKSATEADIWLEEEGSVGIQLANRTLLRIFTSPYTPSSSEGAFQYDPKEGHDWLQIPDKTDIVITHGPPKGIMDLTGDQSRAGDSDLFARIAHVRPQIHCFGHIHQRWGAKKITWREKTSESPSHFTDIKESEVIGTLDTLEPRKFDTPEMVQEKALKLAGYREKGYCLAGPPEHGAQTLFINAAIEGQDDDSQHLPWIVELWLPNLGKI